MSTHIRFPDIKQFREAIYQVKNRSRYIGKDEDGEPIYDMLKPLPILEYEGTVKIHGACSSICWDITTKELWYQSHERIITPNDDNYGFARYFEDKSNQTENLFLNLFDLGKKEFCIFGEWCGKGIQKGVAISELSKRLIVFAIKIDGIWQPKDVVKLIKNTDINVYNIYDYKIYNISIDFNHPELSQNKLIDIVNEVEKECPVGKAFGINGIGEGCVWTPVNPEWRDWQFVFKTKGEKHSISKVKTLVPIDVELVKSQQEFINNVVSDERCKQSISKLKEANKPLTRASLGDFIRWIYNDIVKEESDTAKANNIDLNKMGGMVANTAKKWFFENENNLE